MPRDSQRLVRRVTLTSLRSLRVSLRREERLCGLFLFWSPNIFFEGEQAQPYIKSEKLNVHEKNIFLHDKKKWHPSPVSIAFRPQPSPLAEFEISFSLRSAFAAVRATGPGCPLLKTFVW